MDKHTFVVRVIIPFLLFFSLLFFYLRLIPSIPITYRDEYLWVGEAPFFDLFIRGDFKNPLWQSFQSYNQPKLAIYAFGATLYPTYLKTKGLRKNYSMKQFMYDNHLYALASGIYSEVGIGTMSPKLFNGLPPDLENIYGKSITSTINLIYLARITNAFLLAFAVVIAYFLVLLVSNEFVAIVVGFIYGLNTLVIYSGLKAHSEALFLFLFNLGILTLLFAFKNKQIKYKLLILFSIICGLVTQTKLNGVMLLLFFDFFMFTWLIKVFLRKQTKYIKQYISSILFVHVVSFTIFILLHPFLYTNPIKNTMILYKHRLNVATRQATIESPKLMLKNPVDRVKAIYKVFFTEYPLTSARYIYERYDFKPLNFSFNGIIFVTKLSKWLLAVFAIFFAIGLFRFYTKQKKFCIIFILTQVFMSEYLLWNVYRYYVHLVFFIVLFEVAGCFWTADFLLKKLRFLVRQYK